MSISLITCTNVNWGLFVGWGRVYLTCLLRFKLLVNPPLQDFGGSFKSLNSAIMSISLITCTNVNWGLFVGWGRVYLTCLLRFKLLVNPPLQNFRGSFK